MTMKTLQECKDLAADNWFLKSCGTSGDYRTLSNGVKVGNIKQRNLESVMDDAAERYASQFREPSTEQSDLDSAELRSLKQSILESSLRKYFPQRDMSFHDKVVFAIADATDLGANKMLGIYKGMNDCPLKKHLSQWFDLPEQSGGTEQEEKILESHFGSDFYQLKEQRFLPHIISAMKEHAGIVAEQAFLAGRSKTSWSQFKKDMNHGRK